MAQDGSHGTANQVAAISGRADSHIQRSDASPGATIAKIEKLVENGIFDKLWGQDQPSIPLYQCSGEESMSPTNNPTFPGGNYRTFAQVLYILQCAHHALRTGKVLTKRNIYYEKPSLFGSQTRVDKLVDFVALKLGVGRHDLNIVATGKGLIAGPIKLGLADGSTFDVSRTAHALIPAHDQIRRRIAFGPAQWVLVTEKDATFSTLSQIRYWECSSAGPGLLVTGKGYPDLATRCFVRDLRAAWPEIPIYVLVDFDPYGIHILHCYRSGQSDTGEESKSGDIRLHWLGLRSRDIFSLLSIRPRTFPADTPQQEALPTEPGDGSHDLECNIRVTAINEGVLQLTDTDRAVASRLLRRTRSRGSGGDISMDLRRELQMMLMMNVKAEIQSMNDGHDISRWLDNRLVAEMSRE